MDHGRKVGGGREAGKLERLAQFIFRKTHIKQIFPGKARGEREKLEPYQGGKKNGLAGTLGLLSAACLWVVIPARFVSGGGDFILLGGGAFTTHYHRPSLSACLLPFLFLELLLLLLPIRL